MLEAYWTEYLAEEHERPALKAIRDRIAVVLHPRSEAMKAFEHSDEEDKMMPRPRTVPNPDADFPYPGLDAPLGG